MKPEPLNPSSPIEELIDFPELFRTIRRYQWGIIGITALAATGALLYCFSATPIYRGTVTLLIESREARPVKIEDVYDPGTGTGEYYGTQFGILRSRELAERTVERLKLMDSWELSGADDGARKGVLRRLLPFLPPPREKVPAPTDDTLKHESVIQNFMGRVLVVPVRGSQLVNLSFDAESPVLAAQVANAMADLFIESGLQAKLDATEKATHWLTGKLAEIQVQLQKSEAALQAFREREQLVNVGGTRNLSEEELLDYSKRLRDAEKRRNDLALANEKVRQARSDPRRLQDVTILLSMPGVQRANDSYLAAQETLRQLEERYGAKHPQMATAKARLDTARASLYDQLRIAAEGLKAEYEIAVDNEKGLAAQVAAARSQIQSLDRKDFELSVLQRDVTTNRELYDTFLKRFKETDTAGSYEGLNARVVDPAVVPITPAKPEKRRIVLVATAVGMLAGLLLALLRHLLSEEVRSAEELEAMTRLPVLGVLPLVRTMLGMRPNLIEQFINRPRTPFAEGVRSVRAAVYLADPDRRCKRLMVTSSLPKEGKSSISAAIALSFAGAERVLLIDADLRKPAQHTIFGLPPKHPGLLDVLSGTAPLDHCLFHHEPGKITVLAAGTRTLNPAELLSTDAFRGLVAELSGRFDRIIFDTPPCQAASDALLLASSVNGVLFVVKSDATSRRAIKSSVKHLQYAQAPLLGTVVNQLDTRKNPHYVEGHYYAYNYYG